MFGCLSVADGAGGTCEEQRKRKIITNKKNKNEDIYIYLHAGGAHQEEARDTAPPHRGKIHKDLGYSSLRATSHHKQRSHGVRERVSAAWHKKRSRIQSLLSYCSFASFLVSLFFV